MPKVLVAYVRIISSLNQRLWKGLIWSIIIIIGVLAYSTITRYVLHNPANWTTEFLLHWIIGASIMSGAYLLINNTHVRMDVFYSRWTPRKKAIMDVATFVFYFYILAMIWTFVPGTITSYTQGAISATPWGPPFWPVRCAVTVGAIMLLLQGIANLIKDIATIKGEPLQ